MSLTPSQWILELENHLAKHIKDTMLEDSKTVDVFINVEVPRPLVRPTISLLEISGEQNPSGGMNVVSATQQSDFHVREYLISVFTDTKTGGFRELTKVCSVLTTNTFGKNKHEFVADIDGQFCVLRPLGIIPSGPTTDSTIYESDFTLLIELLVPYTSETI